MKDRITVQEAARRLGIKDDAIRKRIQRGSLDHEKDPAGRVFVYMDATHDMADDVYKDDTRYQRSFQDETNGASWDKSQVTTQDPAYAEMVEMLRSELEDWKTVVRTRDEELRRKDHIIAQLAQRIPELPPAAPQRPPEPQNGRETAPGDGEGEAPATPETATRRRSWVLRFFGFE